MKNYLITILSLSCTLKVFIQAYSINGVHAGINNRTGARPFRQNINTFKHSGPAWDLYILSLQRFMAMDQEDDFSYYKISGIHGEPANTSWDGVIGTAGGAGYCEHFSILFPVWHRPYLALFEEKVWQFAQDIAAAYPTSDQAKYKAAAVSLRIPYWDWSLDSSLPDVTSSPQISINTPTGQQTIDNPLYAYQFHPLNPADMTFLSQFPTTVREPDLQTLQSQDDLVNQGLVNTAAYWHDNAYLIFSSMSDWSTFSTNLETLHGGIHAYVGGPMSPNNGHMTYIGYSSFDPIFWLHHTQVDRMVAIWQAINQYAYIEPQASKVATYCVPAGTIETKTFPLLPFHRNTEGDFHTGETARRLKTFGYSYPELVYWTKNGSNVWALQKEVIAIVNGLYNPKNSGQASHDDRRNEKTSPPSGSSLNADWQWQLNLKINHTAITNPAALFFFKSNASLTVDPAGLNTDPNLLGLQIVLEPEKDRSESNLFSPDFASIPLTSELLSLKDLGPDVSIPWIKKNTVWRTVGMPSYNILRSAAAAAAVAAMANDEQPAPGYIPPGAISVSLVARRVMHARDKTSFPSYGPWTEYGTGVLVGDGGLIDFAT